MDVQTPVERPPVDAFDPHYNIPSDVMERMRRIERLDHDLGHIQAAAADRHAMLRDALSYNAYGTASIEGNPLTLQEVQSLLARGPTPEAMRVPMEREILNWTAFMEDLESAKVPRNVADVEALHARLFQGVLDDRQGLGRLKDRHNFIGRRDGTVLFVPTTPERVALELENALDWYHTAGEHPLPKAWLWHQEFEAIHPFLDGNGRLGRAIMTLMLHHAGYHGVRHALVDYALNRDRQDYYDALREAQAIGPGGGDLTGWLSFLSGVFEDAYADAVARLTVGSTRLNPRQAQVAAWFLRHCKPPRRVKFGDVHAAWPHIPRRTLQEDIKRLVAEGFLDKRGERKATDYGLRKP